MATSGSRFRCSACQARQTARSTSPFAGYRFPDAIIALAVRWYLHYRLPYANVAELLAERGVYVDASTVFDWVQRFAPLYQEAARPQRKRVRGKWSIDETYIKVAGVACYVFRAIDEWGQVIDVYVSPARDAEAATSFLRRAVAETGVRPYTATTDKAPIYPPALQAVLPETKHVTGKLEQQEIERDHQHLKGRYRSMRGFKQLHCAQVVCAGHGFVRNLRNGCYRLGMALGDARLRRVPQTMRAWDEITTLLQAA
jgi:transposase-like protein